jgi:hypothetical protein
MASRSRPDQERSDALSGGLGLVKLAAPIPNERSDNVAPIEIAEVKTRIFTEGREYVLDAAFWPQCGFEFPSHGG